MKCLLCGDHQEYTERESGPICRMNDGKHLWADMRRGTVVEVPANVPLTAILPFDSAERKEMPLVRGLLDYFPAALAAVAECSKKGNDQHNPNEELHWARSKSSDHADCIVRHLIERGTDDNDGIPHSAKVAWRALALLQEELEAKGAPKARGAR